MFNRDDMLTGMGRIHNLIRRALAQPMRQSPPDATTQPTSPFHGGMTVENARHHHPLAPTVFEQHRMPSCERCAVRFEETIEEATEAYGIELQSFLDDLNALTS